MLTSNLHDAVVFPSFCHGQGKPFFIHVMKLGFFKMYCCLCDWWIHCMFACYAFSNNIFYTPKAVKVILFHGITSWLALESFFGDLLAQHQWSKYGWLECIAWVFAQPPSIETSLTLFAALSPVWLCDALNKFNPMWHVL